MSLVFFIENTLDISTASALRLSITKFVYPDCFFDVILYNMKPKNIPSTITLKDKVVAHHISGGTELIPTEIQANTLESISKCQNKSLGAGYRVDD